MRAILRSRMLTAVAAALAMAMLMGFHAVAQTDPSAKKTVAHVASSPKTAFQCEKRFKQAASRTRCFKQLPGASCSHPLEVTKNNPYLVGDTKYLFVGLTSTQDTNRDTAMQYWTWKVREPNVAICPYPKGVALRIFRGEQLVEEIPQSVRSGHLEHLLTGVFDASLTVRGYFIHPRH